jgi:hypothetical protein
LSWGVWVCPTPLVSTVAARRSTAPYFNVVLSQSAGDIGGSAADVALSPPHRHRIDCAGRGCEWRHLLPPNAALAVFLLLALYVFLNATWAADRGAAFGKAAVLLGLILLTFAALAEVGSLDERHLRTPALAFTAGAFLGAIFVLIELLADGVITRMAMNSISLLRPDSAKHVSISHGEVTKINLSDFNRNVAMLVLHLWSGLLALCTPVTPLAVPCSLVCSFFQWPFLSLFLSTSRRKWP